MDSNNIQVNTFSEGMNTDTSDALIKNTLYREARNLRFVTETDSNTGELHLIPGAKHLSSISTHMDASNTTIIAATQLRDRGIFITDTYHDGNPGWTVYIVDNNDDLSDKVAIPVFSTTDTSRVVGEKLSLVTKYEDDNNQKLYIADGKGSVITIQLAVDNLVITDSASDVSAYPSVSFNKPEFVGFVGGILPAGVVLYSYQFYNKYGQQSEISPSTKLIPIVKNNKGYLQTDSTDVGTHILITVHSSIIFDRIRVFRILYQQSGQLPIISVIYDEPIIPDGGDAQIIENEQQGEFGGRRINPRRTDVNLDVYDLGQSAIETLTVEEYNSITGIHIIPKTIEAKDDYLFAGNIKDYSEEFDRSLKDLDFTSGPGCESINLNDTYTPIYDGDGDIGGTGDIISWKFVVTLLYADINSSASRIDTDVLYQSQQLYSNGVADIEFNLYTIKEGGFTDYQKNKTISTTNYNKTYVNPSISSELKSLRRDEVYRYGIVLYNDRGEASSVKWIADIRTPSMNICSTFSYFGQSGGASPHAVLPAQLNMYYPLVVYPLGIEFKIDTESLPNTIVSYEIVRCKREFSDIATISLGVLAKPNRVKYDRSGNLVENPYTPSPFITISETFSSNGDNAPSYETELEGDHKTPLYQFISPEICYNDEIASVLKDNLGLYINPVNYVYPTGADVYNGNDYLGTVIGDGGSRLRIERTTRLLEQKVYGVIQLHAANNDSHFDLYFAFYNKNSSGIVKEEEFRNRFSYIKLYMLNILFVQNYNRQLVKNISISNSLSWNDFSDTEESKLLLFKDKILAIGTQSYVNWVVQAGYNLTYDEFKEAYEYVLPHKNTFILGPAGKCAVLLLQDPYDSLFDEGTQNIQLVGTLVCNIRKHVTPYGGESGASRRSSTYKSFGDYQQIVNDTICVFDGDSYIFPFEYTSIHKWSHPDIEYPRNACINYAIPVETNIDLAHTSGFEFSKEYLNNPNDITYMQEEPGNVNGKFTQSIPQYVYNTVYSISDGPRVFAADDEEYDIFNLDYRVYNSLLKSSNEYIDSWLKFQPANYIDLDSRQGLLTGLRRFKNQLVFWLDNATGLLSVNERSLITDHDKMPLILGSGDVLSRYDYITTSNGMKVDQYVDAQSESTLYWWDYVRRELCAYQAGQGYNVLSKSKFVLNYINTGERVDKPALVFDKAYNELISNIVNEESLIYSELTENFMSIYDICPLYHVQFSDKLLLVEGDSADVYQWNVSTGQQAVGMESNPNELYPYIKYVVNKGADTTKVFDNGEIAGRFYGGDDVSDLCMEFYTPLKQHGTLSGEDITNREYNFRYAIPRHSDSTIGDRLRGKFMTGILSSNNNSLDFSLQYIMTKFRVSWS